MNSSLFQTRDVLRAGWLRYIPFAEKSSSTEHKFWVIFVVYDAVRPYLEFYQTRQQSVSNALSDDPVSKHSLLNCRHISPVISLNERQFDFAISLDTYVIRLAADNEQKMCTQSVQVNNLSLQGTAAVKLFTNQSNELYEPIFSTVTQNLQQLSFRNESHSIPSEEGPPPYEYISAQTSTHRNHPVSFREAQVFKLQKEIEMVLGLNLKVFNILPHGIFIAGWKQKEHPYLHSSFHIGDKLISINGIVMESAMQARSYIKQCAHSLELTVRRIPFGQVFCLKRSCDGEDLGLLREKGTSEIKFVVSNSIAANAGLSSRCGYYHDDECREQTWCITEINNRPLNLFYKNNEVADRLNAIGKEISIIVQPNSFVRRLRKQLKIYKNYKDYIVQ